VTSASDPRKDELDIADLWQQLLEGRLYLDHTVARARLCYATLTTRLGAAGTLSAIRRRVLERVLAGDPLKVVASELELSVPTLSTYCTSALRAMTNEPRASRAPILLVMGALAAHGLPLPRAQVVERTGATLVVAAELPGEALIGVVSSSESTVLRSLLEGRTQLEIAKERCRSGRTIANQTSAIFRKLGVSGRIALRAQAVRWQSSEWLRRDATITAESGVFAA
jgi:DNA-binding NarL/FixJ family response regulator